MKYFFFIIAGLLVNASTLTISKGDVVKKHTSGELLKSANIQTLNYPSGTGVIEGSISFKAIVLSSLFEGVSEESSIIFKCSDGFSAPLDTKTLLNEDRNGAIAYLAIEDKKKPWPMHKKKNVPLGPFYVIWANAKASNIKSEMWPYQVVGFEVKQSFEKLYPKVYPQRVSKKSDIFKGFKVFKDNCFACHTMNGQGTADMGPDLNIPHSPMEYLKEEYFKKLIRNPQSLRTWKKSLMTGFDEKTISSKELDHLIKYLKHQVKQRSL